MKNLIVLLLVQLILCAGIPGKAADLTTQKDKVSYCIGVDIGNSFKNQAIEIDPDILIRGLKDALNGGELMFTEQESREILNSFRNEMRAKQEADRNAKSEQNKIAGTEFLEKNKKEKDIVVLPSGLQYRVLTEGTGDSPKPTDTVSVHYQGTLIDGTEFDSSITRGEPARFKVNGVIPGWTEALQLMKPGSKWQLFIPSDLAYGERGMGPRIGPNAVLIFEVELLEVEP
ncbi:FKBP-type peptidyl-prolyl cis-trans isomerase [bacterium]|nr:FKBP-type peptidyl-prolyl cis-trans isomerase [candidate division CSSED10-310 bacterium]